jgi:hypothetical protein
MEEIRKIKSRKESPKNDKTDDVFNDDVPSDL